MATPGYSTPLLYTCVYVAESNRIAITHCVLRLSQGNNVIELGHVRGSLVSDLYPGLYPKKVPGKKKQPRIPPLRILYTPTPLLLEERIKIIQEGMRFKTLQAYALSL